MIEFAIYIPICLLIVISIFFVAIDKVNIVKKRSEMIINSNEDINNREFNIFYKNSETSETINLSSIYGLDEEERSIKVFNGVHKARSILSNIKLLKAILMDIGFNENFINELNFSGNFR